MSTVAQTLFPSTKPSLGCASVLMLAVSRLHDGCSASSIRLSLLTGGREGRTNPVRHLLTLLTFQMQSALGDWPLKKRLPCPLASGWVWPREPWKETDGRDKKEVRVYSLVVPSLWRQSKLSFSGRTPLLLEGNLYHTTLPWVLGTSFFKQV